MEIEVGSSASAPCITLIREKATRVKEATSAVVVAAQLEGGRVMYEGALFRFPAARVSSYASASRKLFPTLAQGTSVRGLSLSSLSLYLLSLSSLSLLSLSLSLSQFITFLTESSVTRTLRSSFQAACPLLLILPATCNIRSYPPTRDLHRRDANWNSRRLYFPFSPETVSQNPRLFALSHFCEKYFDSRYQTFYHGNVCVSEF